MHLCGTVRLSNRHNDEVYNLYTTNWETEKVSRTGARDFCIFTTFRPSLGPTDTPSQWLPGLSLGGKVAEA